MADVLAPSEAARLTDFSRAFKAAARAVILYPADHPAITTTLGRLVQLTNPPRLTAPLTLQVSPQTLSIAGASVGRPDGAIAELAAMLHAHVIGELTIQPGGDVAAWRSFLLLVGRAPEEVRADGGVSRLWNAGGGRHVRVRQVDYGEVLREHTGGTAATWEQVLANCLTGTIFDITDDLLRALVDSSANGEMLRDLFRQLDESAAAADGTLGARASALLRLLQGLADAAHLRAPEHEDRILRDLAVALGHTPPDLLLAVLAAARERHDDVASAITPIVERMPDGTVASFVAQHAVTPGAPLDRVAQAFQSLVIDPSRRERLIGMAYDTAIVSGAEGEAFEQHWQDVVKALLRDYSDQPFVPDDYARELTGVTKEATDIEQTSDDPPERMRAWLATVATGELRRLDLALILDLLRLEADPARREALMAPVTAVVDDLLLVGDFDAAETIVALLQSDAVHATAPERQRVARATLDALATSATTRHIASHLGSLDEEQRGRVRTICVSIGERLVPLLAEALSVEERPRTRERLAELLVASGATGRSEIERLKGSPNAAVRRTAIQLLRALGGTDVLPDLADLLGDTEVGVQRDAVRAILHLGSDEGYRVLEQALEGGTPQSREAIMQALASQRDERAAPLLVYILEHVDHTGPLGWVYQRALDLLGQVRDPQAVPALEAALHRGEWWAPRRTTALRTAAASALGRIGTIEALQVLTRAAQTGSRGVRSAAQAQLDAIADGVSPGGRQA